MDDTTVIADVEDHLEQAAAKLRDLAEVHIPVIAAFIAKLRQNPLVTAFSAVLPGEIGADAQAVLNGLLPILGALGARGVPQPSPAAVMQPPAPPDAPDPAQVSA